MAGGTFSGYNKVRPGAYFNFKAAPRQASTIGQRGVVALPVPLSWGEQGKSIKLTAMEFLGGDGFAKTGVLFTDNTKAAQMMREAFKGAASGLIYNITSGGAKATADIVTDVTATANYNGVLGNDITIVVKKSGTAFTVETLVKGDIKDTQTVATVAEFIKNDWVTITGDGVFEETAGVPLEGGTNGTVNDDSGYMAAMAVETWNCMAFPSTTLGTAAKAFIKGMRDDEGKYVQGVVNNTVAPDYEGIINTKGQGYVTDYERVEPDVFTCWVAGQTAGALLTQSLTYRVIEGATEIINPLKTSEIEAALLAGYFCITTRQDGAIVVEQDRNSLISYTQDKPYDWCKNRVVRSMDDIGTQIRLVFENNYIGKVDNTINGRDIFKTDCVSYFNEAQRIGAIQNFDSATDITVEAGAQIDTVIAAFGVQPVDSMEKLYAVVTLK